MQLRPFAQLILLLALASMSCNLTKPRSAAPSATTSALVASALPATPGPSTASAPAALEAIFITQPGAGSQITSPLIVQGEADPTFEQNLVVILSDEDSSQLALSPSSIQAPLGARGEFSVELVFTVSSEQPGRISVYSTDAMIGAIEQLASVEVVLLPSGQAQIEQAQSALESIDIQMPTAGDQVSGGSIQVSGFSDYYFESNLGMVLCGGALEGGGSFDELCGSKENILAAGSAIIQSADVGLAGPFAGELSYSISSPTPARLILYAVSPRDGGLLHVSSVHLLLQP